MKIQDVKNTVLQFIKGEAPETPEANLIKIYVKTDGKFYYKDDTGKETALGGGYANPSDEPPVIPSAYDDEFDDTTVDNKWVWIDQGGTTWTEQNGYGVMGIPSVSDSVRMLVQTAPTGDFTVTAKTTVINKLIDMLFGLCLYNNGSGRRIVFGLSSNTTLYRYMLQRYTTISSYSSDVNTNSGGYISSLYLRIRVQSSTIYYEFSTDGNVWLLLASETISNFLGAISHIGLGYKRANTDGNTYFGKCEWFRVKEL